MARVGTYLNFARNTEEVFNFYKSVFGGEFGRGGIQRFKDIPPSEGMPPIDPKDKNLVMHVELKICGDHLLMGTDAPESMGFKLNIGNNVHINLEPDTKAETKRLFNALSSSGKVTMELQNTIQISSVPAEWILKYSLHINSRSQPTDVIRIYLYDLEINKYF